MMESCFSLPPARTAGTIILLCCTAMLAACSHSKSEAPPVKVPEVVVFTVAPQALALSTELPGRTTPFQVAEVRPQVSGLIQKRLFVEGADVAAGVSLYQIDPAIYQAQYHAAKAVQAKAQANLLTSGPKVTRYRELVAVDGVSHQDYDDAVAANEQGKADLEAATAALQMAAINLRYTRVDAPISGRISRSSVTPGALVTAGQALALTTVQQLDPIYVDVTQSSTDLLRLKQALADGKLKKIKDGQAKVSLLLADGSQYALPGRLQFSGVSVDPGTGNVTLRALFPNPKGDLLPGMYVRAVLENGVDEAAILVPQTGVTRNQSGQATALILNSAGKVEKRILVTGSTVGANWLVTSGLAAGDRVIVEGLQKVKPGASATVAAPAAGAGTVSSH